MIDNIVVFYLDERKNVFSKKGKEFALNVKFKDNQYWTITTFNKKPSNEELQKTKDIILRSFEFYHKHLFIPRFNIQVVNYEH